MKMTIEPERRPAVLRIPTSSINRNGDEVMDEIHEESVLVYMTLSREYALCEHPDGTVTLENWGHVRLIGSDVLFGLYFLIWADDRSDRGSE